MEQPLEEEYSAQISSFFLENRNSGFCLSPKDTELITKWWELGYPLNLVFIAINQGFSRLARNQIPIKSLVQVEKDVNKICNAYNFDKTRQHLKAPIPQANHSRSFGNFFRKEFAKLYSLRKGLFSKRDFSKLSIISETEFRLKIIKQEIDSLNKDADVEIYMDKLLVLGKYFYDSIWKELSEEEKTSIDQELLEIHSFLEFSSQNASEEGVVIGRASILKRHYKILLPEDIINL